MKKPLSFKMFVAAMALSTSMISHAATPVGGVQGFNDHCDKENATQLCKASDKAEHSGTFQDLQTVNRQVNNEIKFVDDPVAGRGVDNWQVPTDGTGDCEDYVLAKVQKLLALGWNSDDLRIGILKYRGTYHAVLVATVDGQMYFLDNNNNDVKKVNGFPGNGMRWDRLQVPGTRLFVAFDGSPDSLK